MNTSYIYQLSFANNYKWDSNNILHNTKTGRVIKQVYNNGCIGYNIQGKFMSLTKLKLFKENVSNLESEMKIKYPNIFY